MAHETVWEDGGIAGYKCFGREHGTVDAEWMICEGCGKEIKLSWMVAILERPAPSKREKGR